MSLDSTDSQSAASGSVCFPKGNRVSEPMAQVGSEVESCTWCYLFVHHQKVKSFAAQLEKDGQASFIHKTVRYYRKKESKGIGCEEAPTVSGLVFLRGVPSDLQRYLDDRFPGHWLCKDCSTGRAALIPDCQMRMFMRVSEINPDRIRFLLRPFHYYAQNHTLLRIASGDLAGLEGYVVRIDRDRRLVMDVGGMSVSVSGVHAEEFEVVE